MNTTTREQGAAGQAADRRQGKRFDEVAMALVLIMTGGLWLAPAGLLPEGSWLAGAGLILLGLNAARRARGLKASGFGICVGLVALAAGIGRIIGRDLPFVPALLIVLGAALVLKAARAPRKDEGVPGAM
jgi:peptidoglycan/LPS O-acetylase OafA/YrhL